MVKEWQEKVFEVEISKKKSNLNVENNLLGYLRFQ
jgi:hypothetical protein